MRTAVKHSIQAVLAFTGAFLISASCQAAFFGYLYIRTANDLEAQQVIDQAFSNGLAPSRRGTGHNTLDLLNFLAAPITNPFFLIVYGTQNEIPLQEQRMLGAVFRVRIDQNFWQFHDVAEAAEGVLENDPHDPFGRFHRLLALAGTTFPLTFITGFNGTRVPPDAIEEAQIFVNGRGRAPQQNNGFQNTQTTWNEQPPTFNALAADVPQEVDTIRVGWRLRLASLVCGSRSGSQDVQSASLDLSKDATGNCRYPRALSVTEVDKQLAKALAIEAWVTLKRLGL